MSSCKVTHERGTEWSRKIEGPVGDAGFAAEPSFIVGGSREGNWKDPSIRQHHHTDGRAKAKQQPAHAFAGRSDGRLDAREASHTAAAT